MVVVAVETAAYNDDVTVLVIVVGCPRFVSSLSVCTWNVAVTGLLSIVVVTTLLCAGLSLTSPAKVSVDQA